MPKIESIKKVLIIGSGAIKIGEAGEIDYSGAHTIKTVKKKGILDKYGVRVLGTSVEAIERADNRDLFRSTMLNAGIPIPRSKKANTIEEAVQAAKEIGYPVMIRVAYTLRGQGTGAAFNEDDLRRIASIGLVHSRISQVLVEEYVGKWKEIEYEVLRDHADNCMLVCSMENFDPLGVHTGDSIVVE